jgi:predicted nucleotidyltransferase
VTLEISRPHARLLAALHRAPNSPRFVIIGAAALKHHIVLPRTTADVDLALVAEPEEILALLGSMGWHPDARQAQRWRDDEGHRVDVLPVTDRIVEAGSLLLDGGARRVSMLGFDLALARTVLVEVPGEDEAVEVASLGALVVLKMVAWTDRPHDRLIYYFRKSSREA